MLIDFQIFQRTDSLVNLQLSHHHVSHHILTMSLYTTARNNDSLY